MTTQHFPELHRELIVLLRGLAAEDWQRPTTAGKWRIRDVVAHLVQGDLGVLSQRRDRHPSPDPVPRFPEFDDIVTAIDRANAEWVHVARSLSPQLMIELLEFTGPLVTEHFSALDPLDPAQRPVAWAGQTTSPNWLDTGREFTERWHHQAQVRAAVGALPITSERLLAPLVAVSVWALPHALAGEDAATGMVVTLRVTGQAGGAWSAVSDEGVWSLREGAPDPPEAPTASVTLEDAFAWRMWFGAATPAELAQHVRHSGNARLALAALRMRAVMMRDPARG
jgi:hypothetical protein